MESKLGPLNNKDKVEVLGNKLKEANDTISGLRQLANLYKERERELETQVEYHKEMGGMLRKILDSVFPDWQNPEAWKMLDEEPTEAPKELEAVKEEEEEPQLEKK